MKICTKCGVEKDFSEFDKNNRSKDGLISRCKVCRAEYRRVNPRKEYFSEYRKNNKEKNAAYFREYHIKNKDVRNENARRWRENNPTKHAEYNREYYQQNKDAVQARSIENNREWRKANPERVKENQRAYYYANKEKIREYRRNRYHSDPYIKMVNNIRNRIHCAIRGKTTKSASTQELLGCTFAEARTHIEKQFKRGMTWDNYGRDTWHIDHIIPCAAFDLTDPDQQKQCFHYTNLQPLWAIDNFTKNARCKEQMSFLHHV